MGLRVFQWAHDMFNIKLFIKFNQSSIDKLSIVVGDDDMWYSKTTHNTFPYKVLDILCCDGRQRYDLYPFREIVYSH